MDRTLYKKILVLLIIFLFSGLVFTQKIKDLAKIRNNYNNILIDVQMNDQITTTNYS